MAEYTLSLMGCIRRHREDKQGRVLLPLFRALMVVISCEYDKQHDSYGVGPLTVHLIWTGAEEGLSAPLTFDIILDKSES